VKFTSVLKGKLLPKFTIPDIKFDGTTNPHHHVRIFISTITLKGVDKDIFHLLFPWTFDKEVTK